MADTGAAPFVRSDAHLYRIGGLAGIIGGGLAIVANALHPRLGPDDLGQVPRFLDLIAGYTLWRMDHLLIIISVLLGLIAFVALARSMYAGPGAGWARLALPVALATGAVAAIAFSVDGVVFAGLAEDWAASGGSGRAAILERAETLAYVDHALFSVTVIGLLGLAPLLYGMALRSDGTYAAWIGTVAIIGGVLGLVSGSWMWLSGELNVGNFLILFTLASLAFAVWLLAASLGLYRRTQATPLKPG